MLTKGKKNANIIEVILALIVKLKSAKQYDDF